MYQAKFCLKAALFLITIASCSNSAILSAQKEPHQTSFVSQGNQFAKDGLLREAVDAYKKALAKEPRNLTARRNLGIVLLKAGDAQGAIANLEPALDEFEDNFETNFYLGEAYRAEDKYAEAIYRYKKSLKIQNDEPRAMKSLAWCYFKIRFYSEAISTANKLQKNMPGDEQALMILARTQIKLKREVEALATLKKGLDKSSKHSRPYFQSVIAEAYVAQGKNKEALETWRIALKAQPMLAGALLGTGRLLLDLGRNSEATDYLERAVRIKPKMYEGHYWLARSLESSNPERALRYFNSFRKQASTDPEFVELVLDAKKRSAGISNQTKLDLR